MTHLTHSDRKFIRLQKASIRSKFSDPKKQEEMISELYKKFSGETKAAEAPKTEKTVEKPAEKKEAKAEKAPKVKKDKPKSK